jgi:hypothetical protein
VSWAGVAIAVIGFVGGGFWIGLSLALERPQVQKMLRTQEAQARQRKADGYKVNPAAFYLWFSRTRLRALVFALTHVAFGLWFLAIAKSS